MSGRMQGLPGEFEALEPFVGTWALPTTAERAAMRGCSSEAERNAFYEAAKQLPDALAYLDRKALSSFDEVDKNLMNLMLSLAHVALAIEVQGPEETSHRRYREMMRVTRSPADEG